MCLKITLNDIFNNAIKSLHEGQQDKVSRGVNFKRNI